MSTKLKNRQKASKHLKSGDESTALSSAANIVRAHIVALSGGKDSTAMALALAEKEPRDYEYVITPTGNELDEMFEHWKKLKCLLGNLTVLAETSLDSLIKSQNALPNWRMRWCTRILKIQPFQAYVLKRAPATIYVGLRADEPADKRRGAIYGDLPVEQRYPLREWGWGLKEVLGYLEPRGIKIPARTDCACCFFQTLAEWWYLWKYNRDKWDESEAYEEMTGHTFRSEQRDTWPAALKELRGEFERGRVPRGVSLQSDLFAQRPMMCRICAL